MTQGKLLNELNLNQKIINLDNLKAMFTETYNQAYDVVLEISSQKFFIKLSRSLGQISEFEIVSMKGFMEISRKFVEILKALINHLFSKLD